MNPRRATTRTARALRRAEAPAEATVWRELRDRKLGGYKFRRQQPVGAFVADFCCQAARLIVEIDGESHVGQEVKDANRTAFLEGQGYTVIRFWNTDVSDNLDGVLETILGACTTRTSAGLNLKLDPTLPVPSRPTASHPLPPGGEGRPGGPG